MKKSVHVVSIAVFLASTAFATAGHAQDDHSGFLGDYSALAETKDAAGENLLRYVNPKLKAGAYRKVLIDPTQYYPAPKPSEQVSAATLTEISTYVDRGLRTKLGAKIALATEPGPGVARLRPAITTVGTKTPGLKPYQFIPVAFVVSSAVGRGKEAAIQVEVDLVDSVTGERLAASVRKGSGAKLASDKAKLTLNDVRSLLDKWIDTGTVFVAEHVK